jgi:hypothetical protein
VKLIQPVLAAGPKARAPNQERNGEHAGEGDAGDDLDGRGEQRSGIPE